MTQQYQVGDAIEINHGAFPDDRTQIRNRATLNGAKGVIVGKSYSGQAYQIQLVNSDWPSPDVFLSDGYFQALGGGWPEDDWQYGVNNKDTQLGYRDWLNERIAEWEERIAEREEDLQADADCLQPLPWRYPHLHHAPLLLDSDPDAPVVEVGFPNEDPDTEDDRYLQFVFTEGGMVIYSYVGEDNEIAMLSRAYEEWFDSMEWAGSPPAPQPERWKVEMLEAGNAATFSDISVFLWVVVDTISDPEQAQIIHSFHHDQKAAQTAADILNSEQESN